MGYFLFVGGSCGEEPEISGCTDSSACNYNIEATIDNGNCILSEENLDCNGNCIIQTDDGCECAVLYDECGFCDGDNSSCIDCNGEVNGDSILDMCETCDNDPSNDCVQDCAGAWGGSSIDDECGVCGGNNSKCIDCNGDINGDAFIDGCSDCVGGNTELTACAEDCMGMNGGSAEFDNCGTCDSDVSNDCVQDCSGAWGGSVVNDECGVCDGNNSTCLDCANVPNGDSFTDNCGECVAVGDISCVQGCNGNYANDGTQIVDDECGVCDGDNSTCTDCNGVINGLSFIDYCGYCIESLPASWKIEIVAELVLMNSDSDILVDGSTNYLGADILYTDGFDGFGIDTMEPLHGVNASLSFSFYHGDWDDAILNNQQYYYFTQDIRNHNYNDFLNDGKTWNAELKSIENYYNGTAKLTFNFIEGLSDANITVDVIGSNLSGTSYNINDGAFIDGIIMSYNTIVNFDIHISNLCY